MFTPTNNSPTIAKAAKEPGSPSSLGYASSDHENASAGSGIFSHTSSGTSHSSRLDDPTTEDVVDWRAASSIPDGSVVAPAPVSAASVDVASDRLHGPHVSPGVPSPSSPTPCPSSPSVAVSTQQGQSELDMLKARGEKIPEHIFALRSDTTVEMLRLATDVQKHIVGVEDKVDSYGDCFKTVEDNLGNIQCTVDSFKCTVEQRLDDIVEAVNHRGEEGTQHMMNSGEVGTTDGIIRALFKQSLEESAKASAEVLKEYLDVSTKAMEERLDASAEKRLAAFKEEMSESFVQLKEDVSDQIREELGGEQRKYDSTLALQAFAEDVVESNYDAVVRQVGQLSKVVDKLQKHLPSVSTSSATANQNSPSTSAPDHAPVATPTSASAGPSGDLASTPHDGEETPQISGGQLLLDALAREVMRIATKLRRELGKH